MGVAANEAGAGGATGNVALQFFLPPADLGTCITTFYHTEVSRAGAGVIEDRLHPEWGNLRIMPGGIVDAAIGAGAMERAPHLSLTGPTSLATRFRHRAGRSWGIGMLPLGWARLIDVDASAHADRIHDAGADPRFAQLHGLVGCLDGSDTGSVKDLERERTWLADFLQPLMAEPSPREDEIVQMQAVLVHPEIRSVAQLGAAMGMGLRTLERFARRYFGFTPQLLLRRQRFVRSLAQFMLDPSMRWIDTLDALYHDQAHFVRDFKRFMILAPSEYAQLEHPVMKAAAKARQQVVGEAMQVLHKPGDGAARPS